MAFLAKLIFHVFFPGAAGFAVSYLVIVPQIFTMISDLPGASLLAVAATGLISFSFAALLRGSSLRVTERFFGEAN